MSYSGRNTNRSLTHSGSAGVQPSLPPPAYGQRPPQEPLHVCEIHIYNSGSSKWICIWKKRQKDPVLGALLSPNQPRVLKFTVGHTSARVQIDFRDVSIVECKYLPDRRESEMQLRIWRTGVGPEWLRSGAGVLVDMGRTIFNNFNRAVDDSVGLIGVADVLLIGPGQHMYYHTRALDTVMWQQRANERRIEEEHGSRNLTSERNKGPGSNCNLSPEKRNAKGNHGLENGQNFQSEEGDSQRQNSRDRHLKKIQRNGHHMEKQAVWETKIIKKESDVEDQGPQENFLETTPAMKSHGTYDYFSSRCGSCDQWFESGRLREQHAAATKHLITCNNCKNSISYNTVHDLWFHYKRTGHIDEPNGEPSVIGTRKRKRRNENMGEAQEGVQNLEANHTGLEKNKTNDGTQASATGTLSKTQTIDLDDEFLPNNDRKRKKYKEKQQETSEDNSKNLERKRQRKQEKKQKKQKQKKLHAEVPIISSSSPSPSTLSSLSSLSPSPTRLPSTSPLLEEKEKKKKRKKGTEGVKKKKSSTSIARSKKRSQKPQDSSGNRSRRHSFVLIPILFILLTHLVPLILIMLIRLIRLSRLIKLSKLISKFSLYITFCLSSG